MENNSKKKVSAIRDTPQIVEAKYWNFSQKLGVPKDVQDKFNVEWKTFSDNVAKSFEDYLSLTRSSYAELQNFFKPVFVGKLFKSTTILGSEIDMLLVLNSLPLTTSTTTIDKKEVVIWQTLDEIQVHATIISSITKNCIAAVENVKKANKNWVFIPNDQQNGRLVFTFQNGPFTINIFPVLATVGGSYTFISNSISPAVDEQWRDMEVSLSAFNESYPGFYELIKFCKLLLWKWNSDQSTTPKAKISTSAIDAIVLKLGSFPEWNKNSFYTHCNAILSNLATAAQKKDLTINNRNFLAGFPTESVVKLTVWVVSLKDLLKEDATLLNDVKVLWKDIVQKSDVISNPNAGETATQNNTGSAYQSDPSTPSNNNTTSLPPPSSSSSKPIQTPPSTTNPVVLVLSNHPEIADVLLTFPKLAPFLIGNEGLVSLLREKPERAESLLKVLADPDSSSTAKDNALRSVPAPQPVHQGPIPKNGLDLPVMTVPTFLYTDSQWTHLCKILDSTCWRAFAGHPEVLDMDPYEISRLDTARIHDPTQSPSRHILQNWQYRGQATSINFVRILHEIHCTQGAYYVTELVFLAELAKILDKNRFWDKFASHASSGVPKHTLDHLRYREPYDKPFLPGRSVLRQWRQSVEPMDPSLLAGILKEIACAEGVALVQNYYSRVDNK